MEKEYLMNINMLNKTANKWKTECKKVLLQNQSLKESLQIREGKLQEVLFNITHVDYTEQK